MPVLKLKITGDVSLGGKRPGETFSVKCDDAGVPIDTYWRRRLADEERYGGGHVAKVPDTYQVTAADQPTITEPAPASDDSTVVDASANRTRKKG